MTDLMLRDTGARIISDRDRVRIETAWEALSVNSRCAYQGAWARCDKWLTDNGITLGEFTDEKMAEYIKHLNAEGKSSSTIGVAVAAIK